MSLFLSILLSIQSLLQGAPVQEMVYLHLDNNCYYKGDSIWYKGYVVQSDDLACTRLSRLLYVELLSPDGMLVERQTQVISHLGVGAGAFALPDSLYSGYYELRAYTRYMLNFNVSHRPYVRWQEELFYNKRMAQDFFRDYDGLYSRVVPVYERPNQPGDYGAKYVVSRPKRRTPKELESNLKVTFFPEGGHLIGGVINRVSFEAVNEQGESVERGSFEVTPQAGERIEREFTYKGASYKFKLPKAEEGGCALRVTPGTESIEADVQLKGIDATSLEVGVLCRGVLKFAASMKIEAGKGHLSIPADSLPTGVNNLVVVHPEGRRLADRLFFVNHHDYEMGGIQVHGMKERYAPFERVELQFEAPATALHLSISVRDGAHDDPTYDTGNMLTELLLSSEVKGFVARPDQYFTADDAEHREALDLLLRIQGWRRYNYDDLVNQRKLRYEPEVTTTLEGRVYKIYSFDELTIDNLGSMQSVTTLTEPQGLTDESSESGESGSGVPGEEESYGVESMPEVEVPNATDPWEGIDHDANIRKEVEVLAELVKDNDVAEVTLETDSGGHFLINLPVFYGKAYFFMRAQKKGLSESKTEKLQNKGRLDEDSWPDYYVKRDLFYPIFAHPYSYYQTHHPQFEYHEEAEGDQPKMTQVSTMDQTLKEVEVETRKRRGAHALDYSKPVCEYDAYYLYNLATDYGLSGGKLNMRTYPEHLIMLLFGNLSSSQSPSYRARFVDNLDGSIDGYVFANNTEEDYYLGNAVESAVLKAMKLRRHKVIRAFTDYELRSGQHIEHSRSLADVSLDFVLLDNDATRYTYRDRRIVIDGVSYPETFYSPDYSQQPLPKNNADYRRTLYWNPNAYLDAEGKCTVTFYNNGTPTEIRISAEGLDQGHPVCLEEK